MKSIKDYISYDSCYCNRTSQPCLCSDSSSGKPHAIVMFPGYQSLYVDAEAGGCDVTKWNGQWDAEKGWRFDISELEGLLQNGTRLLVVNVPHNPTGWYPSQDEWSEMMEFCRKHDLYLFSDEMYSMMPRHDGVPPNKAACDLYNKAITLAGVSKTLCGPGLRIGWIAMKDKVKFNYPLLKPNSVGLSLTVSD